MTENLTNRAFITAIPGLVYIISMLLMMTSSNGNIFRVTGLCAGNHRSTMNSPHKGQWRGALMFSLKCVWINGWVNNREAGDLRHHPAQYDVTVMYTSVFIIMYAVKMLNVPALFYLLISLLGSSFIVMVTTIIWMFISIAIMSNYRYGFLN